MIKVFESTAKDFHTNGLKVLFPNSCKEYKKRSLNGWYIEAEFSIKDKKWLVKDNILVAKTKSKINPQGFRINKIEEHTENILITADHVMFDAESYFLEDVRPTDMSAGNALNYINERTDEKSPFSFSSDVNNINTQYVIDKSLLEAMSLIETRWGGSFDADNYNIYLKSKLGNSNGEIIRQKKNLISRVISEDWSNVTTKLYPKGPDDLKLPERFLESDVKYAIPYTRTETFDLEFDDQTSEIEKVEMLRQVATDFLEENKYPQVCYELEANLQNVEIGDKVQVIDNSINIVTEIQEYVYDLNIKKIESITFGNYTKDVKKKFNNIKESIVNVIETLSKQQAIINHQTDLINNMNKNGIVQINDNEILILDKLPIESAKNVWRFGLGGLGFSSNGYEGPFETAITMDGTINANFITAGKMSTERIEGFEQLLLSVEEIKRGKIMYSQVEGKHFIEIKDAMKENLYELSIKGFMELLYPSNDLYPSDNLYPLDSYLNIEDKDGKIKQVHLPINNLYEKDGISDEFLLESTFNETTKKFTSKVKVIRRVGATEQKNKAIVAGTDLSDQKIIFNFDESIMPTLAISTLCTSDKYMLFETKLGSSHFVSIRNFETMSDQKLFDVTEDKIDYKFDLPKDFGLVNSISSNLLSRFTLNEVHYYLLDKELIENLGVLEIPLNEDYNKIYMESFDNLQLQAKYLVKNDLTNIFATHYDLSSSINLLKNQISLDVNLSMENLEKDINASLDLYVDIEHQVSYLNASADMIHLKGDRFKLDSTNCTITENGTIKATNVDLTGTINATDGLIGGWDINQWSISKQTDISEVYLAPGNNGNRDVLVVHRTDNDTYPFYLRANGFLHTEMIDATGGKIGGAEINGDGLYFNSDSTGWGLWGTKQHDGIVFHAGKSTSAIGSAPFRVYHDGTMHAQKAVITGSISSSIISGSSILGGSIKIEGTGFFAFGTGTTHPWASAVNVTGLYGINFYSGKSVNSIGNQQGYVDMGGSNGALQVVSLGTDVVVAGYHVKLAAREGEVYASRNGGANYPISTSNGNISSLNLKENLIKFDYNEYQKAYDLLKKIDFYRFDYKYNVSDNKNEYGFVIDYIEQNENYDQFLYFKGQKAKVLKNKELDYLVRDDDEDVINFKKYSQENLCKFMMTILKSMQFEIETLKERLKK